MPPEQFQIVVRGRAGLCTPASISNNRFVSPGDAIVAAEGFGYTPDDYKVVPLDAHLDTLLFNEANEGEDEVKDGDIDENDDENEENDEDDKDDDGNDDDDDNEEGGQQ